MSAQRDLFSKQMQLEDQLIEQGSPMTAFGQPESLKTLERWMREHPRADNEARWAAYQAFGYPEQNERGTVYSQKWHDKAGKIMKLHL